MREPKKMEWYFMGVLIPKDVVQRSFRLKHKYGRDNYIEEWVWWQETKRHLLVVTA